MFVRHGLWPGLFGWIFPVLLLGLLTAVAVVLIYSLSRRPAHLTDSDPLRRTARRYASGEIERVEFERIQRDLAGSSQEPPRRPGVHE